ncbi:Hypothetical predicted protein [Olea europaea subsp. europaea]|uniref:Uncharacterized protein n=1 Tax=Olea europaea subsp. europaea TaxID=158383 RepID=A0A8S0U0I4_OLEEU|nr:Hypothetical predicted protein [Olea europaea subsp. europaea]
MSVKSHFLILFLGFIMHSYACNARHISVVTDSDFLKKFHVNKIEDKFKLDVNSIEDRTRHTNARRLPSRIPSNGETGALHEGKKGCKEAKKSGSEICESSSPHKVLLNSAKFEDSRRKALMDHKEKVSTFIIDIEREDKIMDTDYHPPHRKAPIHNK